MKQNHFTKKVAVLSGLFTVVILCGMLLFAASTGRNSNLIPEPKTPEEQLHLEQLDARDALLQFENVNDAIISNDISSTYVFVMVSEEIQDSEINNITEYIQNNLDYFENGQIMITYVDPSFRPLKEVYSEAL